MVELDDKSLDAAANAQWTRCRSMADRKSGATWEGQTDAVKAAWIDGERIAISAYFVAIGNAVAGG